MVRWQRCSIVGHGKIGEPSHRDVVAGERPDAYVRDRRLLELGRNPDINRDQRDFVTDSAFATGTRRSAIVGFDATTMRETRLVKDNRRAWQPANRDGSTFAFEHYQVAPHRHPTVWPPFDTLINEKWVNSRRRLIVPIVVRACGAASGAEA